MIKIKNNQRGVSMIALILTVVILIILCGVVLSYVLGDNGLLKGAIRGRIMNRVQALDDTIKAYSLKSDNQYSAKRKSISDLIEQGILAKIQLSDDRTLYYVSNPGLQLMGLKFRGNDFTIDTSKTYDEEELKQMGIYVVDNSLNAAYLNDGQVYGKLIDYGIDLNVYGEGMYNGHVLNIYPKQLTDSTQEVIVVLDCTISMLAPVTSRDSNYMILNHQDHVAGYKATRWSETVEAMDGLVDAYLVEGNKIKKLTIIMFYGQRNPFTITPYYNITSNSEAKAVYHDVYTQAHYDYMCDQNKRSTSLNVVTATNNSTFNRGGLASCKLGMRNLYT